MLAGSNAHNQLEALTLAAHDIKIPRFKAGWKISLVAGGASRWWWTFWSHCDCFGNCFVVILWDHEYCWRLLSIDVLLYSCGLWIGCCCDTPGEIKNFKLVEAMIQTRAVVPSFVRSKLITVHLHTNMYDMSWTSAFLLHTTKIALSSILLLDRVKIWIPASGILALKYCGIWNLDSDNMSSKIYTPEYKI